MSLAASVSLSTELIEEASNVMPDLTISLARHADGSASLACTRRDGTSTWQRRSGRLAEVFPAHDLTHYAVETALHVRQGFYGLVADGWDIADFGAPWPRGPVPAEAAEIEIIVGLLDAERADGSAMTSDELREQGERFVAGRRALRRGASDAVAPRPIAEADLARVRARRDELIARWRALPPGEALVLSFDLERGGA